MNNFTLPVDKILGIFIKNGQPSLVADLRIHFIEGQSQIFFFTRGARLPLNLPLQSSRINFMR